MSREIWNSEDGFVGSPVDYLALIYCMSCMHQNGCPYVGKCGIANNFEDYLKDDSSEFAELVK